MQLLVAKAIIIKKYISSLRHAKNCVVDQHVTWIIGVEIQSPCNLKLLVSVTPV